LELARTARGPLAYLRHLLPIPGVFHIALNAQEGIFEWYEPVLSRLSKAVFRKPILSVPLHPLHRKYFLDVIITGWRLVRRDVVRLSGSAEKWICPVLGKVNDRAFPIALQRLDRIHGLSYVDCAAFKTPNDRSVSFGDILPCGHGGKGAGCCTLCEALIIHIAGKTVAALRV